MKNFAFFTTFLYTSEVPIYRSSRRLRAIDSHGYPSWRFVVEFALHLERATVCLFFPGFFNSIDKVSLNDEGNEQDLSYMGQGVTYPP